MNFEETGRFWEHNAAVWTLLARQGWDIYRDQVNTPAFLEMLPDVSGLKGIDIGCGEGHNTRLLAGRCSAVCGIDIAPTFVREASGAAGPRVPYAIASAHRLPFRTAAFDFGAAFMSLMDMPEPDLVLREAARVIKPGGFLQFSITHPCFTAAHRRQVKDAEGRPYAVEIGGYFEPAGWRVDSWIFSAAPREAAGLPKFQVPVFHRTLSEWLNLVVDAGFTIERVAEPHASVAVAKRCPGVADTRIAPYFLLLRCRR
jgi:SAM-dependent methyltransferase